MKKRLGLSLPVVLLGTAVFGQLWATQTRVYLAPDDHTDFLWSGSEAAYTGPSGAFVSMLDYYLDQADATQGERSEYQSRFNTDGSYWLWVYERTAGKDFARLMSRVADGHISAPLTPLVCTYGGQPAEGVLRGMYYPGRLERRFGVRFSLAQAMENQTMPMGVGALWAGAGAKYVWHGVCDCETLVGGLDDRRSEIYRWVGQDGSQVLMKWFSFTSNQSIGGYAEARDAEGAIEYVTRNPQFKARYPFPDVVAAFGQGWDDLQTENLKIQAAAKQKTDQTRQIIVSNEEDFFRDFEAQYGDNVKQLSTSFGNEWDTFPASLAEVSARVKRAVEKLRTAEAMATLVSMQDPDFKRAPADIAARDLAFLDMGLYFEHDFTNGGPGASGEERIAWQRRLANEIDAYVDGLASDAGQALGSLIRKSGTDPRFYVFNPLSWTRTDFADLPYTGPLPAHVVEVGTGQEVPSQHVVVSGAGYLRIMAAGVPSVGYKVFEVRAGAGQDFSDPMLNAKAETGIIQNEFYRINLAARGAITSLQDKTRQDREFVKVIGGLAINDLGPGTGSLKVENSGPVSVTLTASAGSPLRHVSRVTLFRNMPRIDIRNEVTQNFGNTRWTWAFGFNVTSPDVHHEEVGAVLRAKLATHGGNYAPQNARYDWLTLNHFADVSGSGPIGVTLSNADALFMRVGNSTPGSLDEATPQLSALLGGEMTVSGQGIHDQAGDSAFLQRYALRTHDSYDAASGMRFALEHQNPLFAAPVAGGTAYPEASYSLVALANPDVLLWALKPAEEGIERGIIGRLWNLGGAAHDFHMTFAGGVRRAQRTTHIETDIAPARLSDAGLAESLAPMQMQTYLLNGIPPRGSARLGRSDRGGGPALARRALAASSEAGGAAQAPRARAAAAPPDSADAGWRIVATGDFNGDGQTDILWQHEVSGAAYVGYMNGVERAGGGALPSEGDGRWRIAGSGDFNDDGRIDILWQHRTSGAARIWYMDGIGTRPVEVVPLSAAPGGLWRIAASGDFNGDGRTDILWQHHSSGRLSVWYMNGASRIGSADLPAADRSSQVAAAGDFDGDGQTDILWQHGSAGPVSVWYMHGAVRSAAAELRPAVGRWRVSSGGDFDGDGHADVAVQREGAASYHVWLMDGPTRIGDADLAPDTR